MGIGGGQEVDGGGRSSMHDCRSVHVWIVNKRAKREMDPGPEKKVSKHDQKLYHDKGQCYYGRLSEYLYDK